MTEDEWQKRVTDTAELHGWMWEHHRPARTAKGYRTAISGHVGGPDLLLARDGVVLLRELKTDTGRLTPDQHWWLAALGAHGGVWRPRDWPAVLARLAQPRKAP